MDGTGITPVMPLGNGYGDGFGGSGSWIFLFAILALMWGGNGAFGGNNLGYRPATAEDVNNGFNFNDLQNQNRDIINAITAGTAQSVATTNQVYHDTIAAFNDKYSELQRDVAALAVGQANLLAKENECCCSTLRAIDGVNYNAAMNTAAINANTTAAVQKVLDAIQTNKIEALQSKVNALELAQAVAGVVRYPTSSAYNAGANPFCACNYGCGNGNI
jgi:hypothetical protein